MIAPVALVPFRGLSKGKLRLDPSFGESRLALAEAMLKDTLQALLSCMGIAEVFLVSDDPDAARIAKDLGAHAIAEPVGAVGLNAVMQACSAGLGVYQAHLLCVLGDLPLLQTKELDQLLLQHNKLLGPPSVAVSAKAMSIVPDRHGQGSNMILCSPPGCLRFHYGLGSLEKHLAFAQTKRIQSQVVELEGAGHDFDVAADVREARQHPLLKSAKHTSAFLQQVVDIQELAPTSSATQS